MVVRKLALITFGAPPAYKDRIRKLAKENRRSVSEELRIAVEEHLARAGTILVPEAGSTEKGTESA